MFNSPTLSGIILLILQRRAGRCTHRILNETKSTRAGRPMNPVQLPLLPAGLLFAPRILPSPFASFALTAQLGWRWSSVRRPQSMATTFLKQLVALSEAEVNARNRKNTEPRLRHHRLGLHRGLGSRKARLVEFRRSKNTNKANPPFPNSGPLIRSFSLTSTLTDQLLSAGLIKMAASAMAEKP